MLRNVEHSSASLRRRSHPMVWINNEIKHRQRRQSQGKCGFIVESNPLTLTFCYSQQEAVDTHGHHNRSKTGTEAVLMTCAEYWPHLLIHHTDPEAVMMSIGCTFLRAKGFIWLFFQACFPTVKLASATQDPDCTRWGVKAQKGGSALTLCMAYGPMKRLTCRPGPDGH